METGRDEELENLMPCPLLPKPSQRPFNGSAECFLRIFQSLVFFHYFNFHSPLLFWHATVYSDIPSPPPRGRLALSIFYLPDFGMTVLDCYAIRLVAGCWWLLGCLPSLLPNLLPRHFISRHLTSVFLLLLPWFAYPRHPTISPCHHPSTILYFILLPQSLSIWRFLLSFSPSRLFLRILLNLLDFNFNRITGRPDMLLTALVDERSDRIISFHGLIE